MKHSARQLANVLGVQTSTITRDIQKRRISAEKNDRGEWQIDASEVVRVYGDRVALDEQGNIAANTKMNDETKPGKGDATGALQAKLDAAERLASDRQQTIDDLRRRLDNEGEERRKLTAILTDQSRRPEPAPPSTAEAPPRGLRGWLHRLTGA